MKNSIVQFRRPITFLFCLGSVKCWIREISVECSLLTFAWDDQKLVCCLVNSTWAKDYAEQLIGEALRQMPLSLPDGEMLEVEYPDDP
jgi:hypothetical protein